MDQARSASPAQARRTGHRRKLRRRHAPEHQRKLRGQSVSDRNHARRALIVGIQARRAAGRAGQRLQPEEASDAGITGQEPAGTGPGTAAAA
jgi:hypothetical protein